MQPMQRGFHAQHSPATLTVDSHEATIDAAQHTTNVMRDNSPPAICKNFLPVVTGTVI